MKDEDYYQLRLDSINEQLRFNRAVIKRLNQRNTELKYIKIGLTEDMKKMC